MSARSLPKASSPNAFRAPYPAVAPYRCNSQSRNGFFETRMTRKLPSYLPLVVGLLLCCAPLWAGDKSGEDVQRVVTEKIAFPPTRVDSVAFRDFKIPDFEAGSFTLVKAPRAPFQILDKQNVALASGRQLLVENRVLFMRLAFRPTAPGSFRDTIILKRQFPVRDSVFVIVEGFAFVPSRTMHVDFGGIVIGDTATRLVRVLPDVAVASTWKILRPVPPFSVVSDTLKLVPDPDQPGTFVHAFILRFAPVVKGQKKGQATFIRHRFVDNETRVVDTLVVSMSGNGEEILPRTTIPFIRLMVGDSAIRGVEVSIRDIGNTSYKPIYQPSGNSPFRLHNYDQRNDKLIIEASYAPTDPANQLPFGDSDEIVFYRYSSGGEPLDSLVCTLSGAAVVMEESAAASFSDMRIGKLDSVDVRVTIPIRFDIRAFSYQLRSDRPPSAFTTARVIVPEAMPSQDSAIVVRVYNTPAAVGAFSDVLYLVRTRIDTTATDTTEIAADTTEIYVTSEVKPRTVKLRASIARVTTSANNVEFFDEEPEMSARIGDTVTIVVLAKTGDAIDVPLTFTTVRCSLAYNPTVLVPITSTLDSAIVVDDSAVFVFGSPDATANPISTSGRVLARASFVAVMGDADRSPLNMTGLHLEPRDFIAEPLFDSATVRLTNVWSYQDGRLRLINPFQKSLGLDVSPNPVASSSSQLSTITVANVPQGTGKLQIVSTDGAVLEDYSELLRSGDTKFGFPTLSPGVYFVRLLVRGEEGSADAGIASVVRLVIVY